LDYVKYIIYSFLLIRKMRSYYPSTKKAGDTAQWRYKEGRNGGREEGREGEKEEGREEEREGGREEGRKSLTW
jgi:hypothetical protein